MDLITIGRSSVDLYGQQIGGRLEDMSTFNKYIGGSPTNIAAGTARLGLKSALITRVGNEHMGRFIKEQLQREGVDTRYVITDSQRLTALVILGIRDQEQFPLIFYRENCADMALCEDDIQEDFIAEAKCLVVTGTHLSNPKTESAVLKALKLAKKHHLKTVLDIDYRPNLWGLSGHDDGENRFIASHSVTDKLQSTLDHFDLIVGTEEEFYIAGGSTDILEALRKVRQRSQAVLVCKRGAMGAVVLEHIIPDTLDEGIQGKGFEIEVFNVLGAGDGFMSGFLRGWLKGEGWEQSLTYANAVGAMAVSRHGCTPAYPSWQELSYFLKHGSTHKALRHDAKLEQIHWSTTRQNSWHQVRIFAFDHRMQLEEIAKSHQASLKQIGKFKLLCLKAAKQVASNQFGYGVLVDQRLGEEALYQTTDTGLWVGRPVELPGSYPLQLEIGEDYGSALADVPRHHVIKVLCFYHPDDQDDLKRKQEATLLRLYEATRANQLELLVEIIPSKIRAVCDETTAKVVKRLYEIGIYPDWWKLEPMNHANAWSHTCDAIKQNDPDCRGVIILGLGESYQVLKQSFEIASKFELVKGFAGGRTIFGASAQSWFAGKISDEQAIADMAKNYQALCQVWDKARSQ